MQESATSVIGRSPALNPVRNPEGVLVEVVVLIVVVAYLRQRDSAMHLVGKVVQIGSVVAHTDSMACLVVLRSVAEVQCSVEQGQGSLVQAKEHIGLREVGLKAAHYKVTVHGVSSVRMELPKTGQ